MDQQKLRSLVFEKTGIKIDTSDPVFAIVAMNEALLEEAVQRHLVMLEQSSKAILQQLQALRSQAGNTVAPLQNDDIWETALPATGQPAANTVSASTASASPEVITSTPESATMPNSSAAPLASNAVPVRSLSSDLRLAWITSLFSAVLVLLGLATFGPKVPEVIKIESPKVAAINAQQEAQLKQAEKLQKILPKLDAKTRAAIEAEMQKP